MAEHIEVIPPFSDFGFKNLYCKGEKTKQNLIFLLNEVLKGYPGIGTIVSIEYKDPDHQAQNMAKKSTRFDIYCRTDSGRVFIIEMQNEMEAFRQKRLIFYLCQTVTENDGRIDPKVAWDYNFPPVIAIMFCNFIDREIDREEINYFGLLNLKTFKPFGHHVGLCVIQLPLFPKKREECKTTIEKIIFSMQHMEDIVNNRIESFSTKKGDFYSIIEQMSHKATLTNEELHAYNQWLKVTNDERLKLYNAEKEGESKGRAEGRAEGLAEGFEKGAKEQAWKTAQILFEAGQSLDLISKATSLSIEELNSKFN